MHDTSCGPFAAVGFVCLVFYLLRFPVNHTDPLGKISVIRSVMLHGLLLPEKVFSYFHMWVFQIKLKYTAETCPCRIERTFLRQQPVII